MSDSRMTGLALMAIAIGAFIGTTSDFLPPATFFAALPLFVVGAFKFMKSNHVALEKAQARARRAIQPRLSENRQTQIHAQRQADRQGGALTYLGHSDSDDRYANPVASTGSNSTPPGGDFEIDNRDSVLLVDTDVSFPIEVQTGDALADQLLKLNRLLEQGVLTEEEYAVAKAKLLS